MSYTAAVITVSDLGSQGLRQDTRGPAVCAMLEGMGFSVVHTAMLPDEAEQISAELRACADEKKAARENLSAVLGALEHAMHMLAAEGHG